jgi:hypothetical protein
MFLLWGGDCRLGRNIRKRRYADDSTTYREYKRWKWTWECEKCDWIEYSWEQTNLNYNYCPGCGRRITNYYYWEGDEEEI